MQPAERPRVQVLRLPDVIAKTGMSRMTIYRRIDSDGFPKSFSLGGRSVGWWEHDAEAWLRAKAERREAL